MALVLADRVQVLTSTTGTGTLTLGSALDGFQDFSVIGNGNTTYYTITNGNNWEVGIGTYTASGTTLSRDTILASSNSDNAINLSGSSNVFVTYPADKSVNSDDIGVTVQGYDADTTKNDVANTFTANQVISVNSTSDALRITQIGSGNSFVVEDSNNPDSTPFLINAQGDVSIGSTTNTLAKLEITGTPTVSWISLASVGTTTGYNVMAIQNTGSDFVWGVESSAGGGFFTGSSSYAAVLGTTSNTPVEFFTNNALGMTLTSTGLDVEGTVTATTFSGILDGSATGLILNDGYTEEVFAITDGATVNLDPNNGSIQTWTLGANRTPSQANWAAGQSIVLQVDDGTDYTITWTTLAPVWKTDGGTAPTLETTGVTIIVLWKVDTTIYGARVGDA
jgi:hypothetical protein